MFTETTNSYIRSNYPSQVTDSVTRTFPTDQFTAGVVNSFSFISSFDVKNSIENEDPLYNSIEFDTTVTSTLTDFSINIKAYGATLIWKVQIVTIHYTVTADTGPIFQKSFTLSNDREHLIPPIKKIGPKVFDSFT